MSLTWSPDYAPVDGDFADVSLLLLGEGIDGSTTILDSSSNNLSVTAVGNAKISTAQTTPFGASDGVLWFPNLSGDYVTTANDSAFQFGSGDFTFEYWFYATSLGGTKQHVNTAAFGGNYSYAIVTESIPGSKGRLRYYLSSTGNSFDIVNGNPFGEIDLNVWNHIALARSGNTITAYLNGVAGNSVTSTAALFNFTTPLYIGTDAQTLFFAPGYFSNIRITKGVARYTENFDVPTAPFPILSPSTRIEVGDGFDVEAANYILAVEAADAAAGQSGGLEPAVRTAINNFVVGCKSDGIWNAIKASCLLSGARTLEGALVPLKGVAPTNFNFTLSDYDRELGLLGNGSTKYLNSNQANDGLPQDSIHLSFYIRSLPSVLTALAFTSYGSTPTGLFLSTSNTFEFYLNSLRLSTGIASSTGFVGASRSASNTSLQRVNGTEIPSSVASGTRKTDSIYIFNDASGASTYASNARIAFYSIGESLDLALLDTRISDFITAIGVAIP